MIEQVEDVVQLVEITNNVQTAPPSTNSCNPLSRRCSGAIFDLDVLM